MNMATLNGNYREFTLDNGLVVALQNTPTQTISGRLRVFHGGLHERKGEEGLAHFLEHTIMSGGGRKYSPAEAEQIMSTFGAINAGTNYSATSFPISMLAQDLESYLDFISDVVFQPRFDFQKVEQERQRVLREVADKKSNPAFQDVRDFEEALYGPDSPHTYFVLGKEEVISKATPQDLRTFHERGYNPNNMDLILVGALPENAHELIIKYFGQETRGPGSKYNFVQNPELNRKVLLHRLAPELYNNQDPNSSSADFNMGFVAPPEEANDSYAVWMLVNILGYGGNSRLFKRVSQEMGLAYSLGSCYTCANKAGVIEIGGRIQALKADDAIDAVFKEIDLLKSKLIDLDELNVLRKQSMYHLAVLFETNQSHADAIQNKWDLGRTPELQLQKMNELTPEMIQDAANKYFPTSREEGNYILLLRDPLKK